FALRTVPQGFSFCKISNELELHSTKVRGTYIKDGWLSQLPRLRRPHCELDTRQKLNACLFESSSMNAAVDHDQPLFVIELTHRPPNVPQRPANHATHALYAVHARTFFPKHFCKC